MTDRQMLNKMWKLWCLNNKSIFWVAVTLASDDIESRLKCVNSKNRLLTRSRKISYFWGKSNNIECRNNEKKGYFVSPCSIGLGIRIIKMCRPSLVSTFQPFRYNEESITIVFCILEALEKNTERKQRHNVAMGDGPRESTWLGHPRTTGLFHKDRTEVLCYRLRDRLQKSRSYSV